MSRKTHKQNKFYNENNKYHLNLTFNKNHFRKKRVSVPENFKERNIRLLNYF